MTVDELAEYGLERMDEDRVRGFLTSHAVGVLGLPDEGAPYMLPLSYVFEEWRLYFTYLLGESSRKGGLTERAGRAGFLVYDVETQFTWRSVLVSGNLRAIPEAEWPDFENHPRNAWRPDVLRGATTAGGVEVYELDIEEWDGIQQVGLAPGFRENVEP
jgi:hypothetical protein